MSQRDLENVKSKLKGLWAQYSSGSTTSTSAAATASGPSGNGSSSNGRAVVAAAEPVEEMLLFPTYAFRDERLKVWRVQVRGWGFCRNPNTRRVRLAASLMRRFIRVPAGGDSDQMLLDRISYLFAGQPTSSDMVKVAMSGIAEPAPFELHMTPNSHRSPQPRGASAEVPPTAKTPIAGNPPPKPPRTATASGSGSGSGSGSAPASLGPVSLLDAPIVLTSQFDPLESTLLKTHSQPGVKTRLEPPSDGHGHDRMVRNPLVGVEPTIIQKALQIDAFSWQNLVLDEGLFQGEILLGYNELEWLLQSYKASKRGNKADSRRLVELRGKLFGWPDEMLVSGLAHLVEPQGISVVSDIDDTIKASNITAEKRIVLETVFAKPMQAVPGMSELYRSWYDLGCEFHYVSNSPWQLYPSLDEFFHRYRFPPGSAHLRSFDPNDLLSIKNYTGTPQLKRDTIELLFRVFPQRKFIFVGDCGEHDLETYTDLARRYPQNVLRIYIRDVFAPMSVATVTTDTHVAGKDVTSGLIPYGIMRPTSESPGKKEGDTADLIQLDDVPEKSSLPPPVPPKPAGLSAGDRQQAQQKQQQQQQQQSVAAGPPKPPRKAVTVPEQSGIPSSSVAPPSLVDKQPPVPPRKPAISYTQSTQSMQSMQNTQSMPGGWGPGGSGPMAPNMPLDPNDGDITSAERFEAKVSLLRGQAQEWLAFYAQKFYVAPTQSFLRYSAVFMPTVEQNMHIIDYEAVPQELLRQQHYQLQQLQQIQQQQMAMTHAQHHGAGNQPLGSAQYEQMQSGNMNPAVTFDLGSSSSNGPFSSAQTTPAQPLRPQGPPPIAFANSTTVRPPQRGSPQSTSRSSSGYSTPLALGSRATSFASFNIPEPPPPEAQLARNNRRLGLWKQFLSVTRDLPPNLCRLFVDASNIKQDEELARVLIPRYSQPQM
ncbi:hypothetical protein GGI07_002753 [Coemansia sp. Benny D115]|nr:hypothetical protein GGI07_002753 [Coemansia sp. Benny D115]